MSEHDDFAPVAAAWEQLIEERLIPELEASLAIVRARLARALARYRATMIEGGLTSQEAARLIHMVEQRVLAAALRPVPTLDQEPQ